MNDIKQYGPWQPMSEEFSKKQIDPVWDAIIRDVVADMEGKYPVTKEDVEIALKDMFFTNKLF